MTKHQLTLILLLYSCLSFSQYSKKTKSQYFTDSLYSNSLQEYRKHNVYLPKQYDSRKKYPIIYATDGATIGFEVMDYKRVLDSLIGNRLIKPVVFIASHYNGKKADSTFLGEKMVYLQYRNFEYVDNDLEKANDSLLANRFLNHLSYFKNELIPTVENKLNLSTDPGFRIFYGFSNGAAFGVNFLNRYQNLIGTFICFSTVGAQLDLLKWDPNIKYPRLFLQYGTKEGDWVSEQSVEINSMYEKSNSQCVFNSFDGGHDWKIWNVLFAETLIKILEK